MNKTTHRTEEDLRAALDHAQALLEAAKATRAELDLLFLECGLSHNGTITLSEARLLHADARNQYRRALARFSGHMLGVAYESRS